MVQIGWLLVMAAGMTWWVRNDARQYRLFKQVEDSATRRRFYWRWTVQSFAVLVGASLVSLWLAGNMGAPFTFPAAFAPLSDAFATSASAEKPSSDAMLGIAMGLAASVSAVVVLQYRRVRQLSVPTVGDIEPLLPRNGQEKLVAVPLSLNAGLSEELFFRCALPLLIVQVTGSPLIAFVVAGVAFGLAHAYQGWKGIIGTMVAGAVLTIIYLQGQSLLRVMAVHAMIDLVAFIIRPTVVAWAAQRMPAPRPA